MEQPAVIFGLSSVSVKLLGFALPVASHIVTVRAELAYFSSKPKRRALLYL